MQLARRTHRARVARLARAAGLAPSEVRVGVVGGIPEAPLTALPADRRAACTAHLIQVADAAFASDEAPPGPRDRPVTPPASPLGAAFCGTCRGLCCRPGADSNAFVTRASILATRSARPDLNRDRMITLSTDALPEVSTTGSCVYHGARGCTLARWQRSDICNGFRCRSLIEIEQGDDPDRPLLIVAQPGSGRGRSRVFGHVDRGAGLPR